MQKRLAIGLLVLMMAVTLTSCASMGDSAAQHNRCYANRTSNH